MARTLIYEDSQQQTWLVTSDVPPPDQPGGWQYEEVDWKPGTPQANAALLQSKANTALSSNVADQNQDATIRSNAATVTATTGTLSTAQLSTYVRQLAQAVSILAQNDVNTKKELNLLIRLLLAETTDISDT